MSSAFTFSRLVRSFRLIFMINILTSSSYAFAAPSGKGNVTIQEIGDSTFASEPHGRGTVGILLSCTTTFIFCIWTAVHPNVVPGVKSSQRLYYKAVLMVISILIPEGLVVSAIGEYREAKRLLKAWNECENIPPEYKCKMDMHVAFFVVMGGFIVDEINPTDDPLPAPPDPGLLRKTWRFLVRCILCKPCRKEKKVKKAGREFPYRARLTPTGFKKYMKEGLIDHKSFSKADIVDKGKASAIAKSLAGIQALWLVVQSISRVGVGLPLSLLEIHVLIHVGRTALIYGFWWYKPLDVNEPIRIYLNERPRATTTADDQEEKGRNLALEVKIPVPQSDDSGNHGHHDPGTDRVFREQPISHSPCQSDRDSTFGSELPTPLAGLAGLRQAVRRESVVSFPSSQAGEIKASNPAYTVPQSPLPRIGLARPHVTSRSLSAMLWEDFHHKPLQGLLNGTPRWKLETENSKSYRIEGREPKIITSQSPQSSYLVLFYKAIYDIIIYLDVADREEREERAAKPEPRSSSTSLSGKEDPPLLDETQPEIQVSQSGTDKNVTQTSITEGTQNQSSPSAKDPTSWALFSFVMFGEMFLVCLTGALHALAWNKYFPTPIERWLWRSSSLTMCACALGIFVIANFSQYEQDLIATMLKFHLDSNPTRGLFSSVLHQIDVISSNHAVKKDLDPEGASHAERKDVAVEGAEYGEKEKTEAGTPAQGQISIAKYIRNLFGISAVLLLAMIYFFSVSYITVESFIALREAPRDMWLTPSWTDYWPHV